MSLPPQNTGFWSMGGFAMFVWPSYALGLLVLLWNVLAPRWRRRSLMRELLEEQEDEES
jgi:heme exporter protein CcmD